jgi:hypothetical protein
MTSKHTDLDWIGTEGGPHVVLHATTAREWGGVADDQPCDGDIDTWGDYGLACGVEDFHGIVEFGSGTSHRALVLGDEPLESAFLPEQRCIIRWWCANSEAQLLTMVEAQLAVAQWESALAWEIPAGGLVMIDAGYQIRDYAPDGCAGRPLVWIDLPAGRYRVQTARVSYSDGSAVAVLHRFCHLS